MEKYWDNKGQIFAGTRPIKSSKSVNIGPKCIFYSAFNRKQIRRKFKRLRDLCFYLKVSKSRFFGSYFDPVY